MSSLATTPRRYLLSHPSFTSNRNGDRYFPEQRRGNFFMKQVLFPYVHRISLQRISAQGKLRVHAAASEFGAEEASDSRNDSELDGAESGGVTVKQSQPGQTARRTRNRKKVLRIAPVKAPKTKPRNVPVHDVDVSTEELEVLPAEAESENLPTLDWGNFLDDLETNSIDVPQDPESTPEDTPESTPEVTPEGTPEASQGELEVSEKVPTASRNLTLPRDFHEFLKSSKKPVELSAAPEQPLPFRSILALLEPGAWDTPAQTQAQTQAPPESAPSAATSAADGEQALQFHAASEEERKYLSMELAKRRVAAGVSDDHEDFRFAFSGTFGRKARIFYREMSLPREEPWLFEDVMATRRKKWEEDKLKLKEIAMEIVAEQKALRGSQQKAEPKEPHPIPAQETPPAPAQPVTQTPTPGSAPSVAPENRGNTKPQNQNQNWNRNQNENPNPNQNRNENENRNQDQDQDQIQNEYQIQAVAQPKPQSLSQPKPRSQARVRTTTPASSQPWSASILDHNRIVRALRVHHSAQRIFSWGFLFSPKNVYHLLAQLDSASDQAQGSDSGEAGAGDRDLEGSQPLTELFISSPVASMHRMAVVEDGKLVELILEPLENRKKFGEIYLGIVQDMAPKMKAAFIDVGNPPENGMVHGSLMELRINRFPFTIPPLDVKAQRLPFRMQEQEAEESEPAVEEEEEAMEEMEAAPAAPEPSERGSDKVGVEGDIEEALVEEEKSFGKEYYSSSDPSLGTGSRVLKNRRALHFSSHTLKDVAGYSEDLSRWASLRSGMLIITQVVKEKMGNKEARVTPFPFLDGRYMTIRPGVYLMQIPEECSYRQRLMLKQRMRSVLPHGFGCIFNSDALNVDQDLLERDAQRLLQRWEKITLEASRVEEAIRGGEDDAAPCLLFPAVGPILFALKELAKTRISRIVVDSKKKYDEVLQYLEDFLPELSNTVELYEEKEPIFHKFHDIETQILGLTERRINLPSGGNIIIEKTEGMWVADVNGGKTVLTGDETESDPHLSLRLGLGMEDDLSRRSRMQPPAVDGATVLNINLEAVRQVAKQLRLRDIGGIIAMDLITMDSDDNQKAVLEMRRAVARDRAFVQVLEVNVLGVMMMTRRRTRQSLLHTLMEPCDRCHSSGHVEAMESIFLRLEIALNRARMRVDPNADNTFYRRLNVRVDKDFHQFLLSDVGANRLDQICSALKLKPNLTGEDHFHRGQFLITDPILDAKSTQTTASDSWQMAPLVVPQVVAPKEDAVAEVQQRRGKVSAIEALKAKMQLKKVKKGYVRPSTVVVKENEQKESENGDVWVPLPVLNLSDLVEDVYSSDESGIDDDRKEGTKVDNGAFGKKIRLKKKQGVVNNSPTSNKS